jgi:hypothetical protein
MNLYFGIKNKKITDEGLTIQKEFLNPGDQLILL